MRWRTCFFCWMTLVAMGAIGCAPEIGDSCLSNLDCPESATCDTSAEGGYCLIYECTENSCPDEAVCVTFRTFTACMRYCESNGDCREDDGQVCRTDIPPTPFCYQPLSEP